MKDLLEIIEETIEACYAENYQMAREKIDEVTEAFMHEKSISDDLLALLGQINEALKAKDFVCVADYFCFGVRRLLLEQSVPDSLFFNYSDLKPEVSADIYYQASFLDSEPVLCVKKDRKKVNINSLFSPLNEVEYCLKNLNLKKNVPLVCVFGIGTGILVDRILEKIPFDSILLIFEPDRSIIDYCKSAGTSADSSIEEKKVWERIEKVLSDERVFIYVESEAQISIQRFFENYIEYINIAGLVNIVNNGYTEIYYESCLRYYRELNDYRVRLLTNKNTLFYFKDYYLENSFYNLHLCKKMNLKSELETVISKEIPVIIVSAGPSLNKNIDLLKQVKNHFLVIAVDTAVKYLLKRDIIPDLTITIDPEKPVDYYSDPRSHDIPCIFASVASKEILDRINERVFLLDGRGEYMELLLNSLDIKTVSSQGYGGSVATAAFSVCVSLGIKNIILIGQDLAYQGNDSHADGVNDGSDNEVTIIEGIDGGQVRSRSDWLGYLKWFETAIDDIKKTDSDIRIIDATEGGAKIHGSEIMSLRETMDCFKDSNGNLPKYDFSTETKKLFYLLDEEGYKKLCDKHKSIIKKIHNIEVDSYEAYNICENLLKMMNDNNVTAQYIHKQNKKITDLRKRIEKSPVFSIILEYAQNYTLNERTRLELEEVDDKTAQINLVKILKLTFDSYVKVSKKVYEIAKKCEKVL